MPPTGQPDFSKIGDAELSQMLKDEGVDVGPINAATRRTYERKLAKLKFGVTPAPSHRFQPVDNDENEGVYVSQSEPMRRTVPLTETVRRTVPLRSESPQSYEYAARETFSSEVRSRPHLPADRRTTSHYSTPTSKPTLRETSEEENKSIPLWLILTAVAIVVILLYLIYINMEPSAVSNIPGIQDRTEV